MTWLGVFRGLCSLWIVYYHLYTPYLYRKLPLNDVSSFYRILQGHLSEGLETFPAIALFLHDIIAGMSMQAVGGFILLSGFGLTRSLLHRSQEAGFRWKGWYRIRFWRLYPTFWFAHLIFLTAPWVAQLEPIDWRFWVSLTGIRAYPMESILFYGNASWWFFWLVLQLYAVFPLLWWSLRKLGAEKFAIMIILLNLVSRWWILYELQDWRGMIIGGLFLSRIGEFGMGMVLAIVWKRDPENFSKKLIGWRPFCFGFILYGIGLYCYSSLFSYLFVDLVATCGFCLLFIQIAHLLGKIKLLARFLIFAGSVSLSTFLLHQPWAITLGRYLRDEEWWVFAFATLLFLPTMVLVAWGSEKIVDFIKSKLTSPSRVS